MLRRNEKPIIQEAALHNGGSFGRIALSQFMI